MALNLLAIETATEICSVAFSVDGRIVAHFDLHQPRKHAERLVPVIQDMLGHADVSPSSIDVVAVSKGPGSYTGLRIGTSTAKGLCWATGAGLVGVPTLRALACGAGGVLPEGSLLLTVLHSRKSEVYAAAFRLENGIPVEVLAPCAVSIDDLIGIAGRDYAADDINLAGEAASSVESAVEASGGRLSCRILSGHILYPSARHVALLGYRMWMDGIRSDLDAFEPHYLKEFEVRKSGSIFDRLAQVKEKPAAKQ